MGIIGVNGKINCVGVFVGEPKTWACLLWGEIHFNFFFGGNLMHHPPPFLRISLIPRLLHQHRGWKWPWQGSKGLLGVDLCSQPHPHPSPNSQSRSTSGQAVVWPGKKGKNHFFPLPEEQLSSRELPSLRERTQTSPRVDLDRKLYMAPRISASGASDRAGNCISIYCQIQINKSSCSHCSVKQTLR